MDETPKGRTLHSWKEIATHLGVTVRSVQRWEKTAGVPVYRQGTGKKARVFAYTDELQEWLEAGGASRAAEAGPPPRLRRRYLIGGAGVLLASAALLVFHLGLYRGQHVPNGWTLEGSRLRIVDSQDHLCWEIRLPPFDRSYEAYAHDKVVIGDIDGDGRKEVLLNYAPEDLPRLGGTLMCFEQGGQRRWEYRYGAQKTFGARTFSQSYLGRFVRPVQAAGRRYVLAVANHHIWYPAQAALLDPATGRRLEEYWHPGAFSHCILYDLDGDGDEDLLLGAINNPGDGLGHAALAVLELPFSRAPRTPAPPDDPFPAMTGGGELAYLLFPQPDINAAMGTLPLLAHLGIDPRQRIMVQTPLAEAGGLVYYLDFRLQVREFRFSDNFAALHRRLQVQGLLDHALSPAETKALGMVLRFRAAPDGNSPELARRWAL